MPPVAFGADPGMLCCFLSPPPTKGNQGQKGASRTAPQTYFQDLPWVGEICAQSECVAWERASEDQQGIMSGKGHLRISKVIPAKGLYSKLKLALTLASFYHGCLQRPGSCCHKLSLNPLETVFIHKWIPTWNCI